MKKVLFVAATEGEAAPFKDHGLAVVRSGVGKVNAAVATVMALERGTFDAVVSVGVAGALPGSGLTPGAVVVADRVVYAEEGMSTSDDFLSIDAMGFPLASFIKDNAARCEEALVASLASRIERARTGAIATVATCSANDELAQEIAKRTGALAEAMEGAAVVHAAGLIGVPAGELRVISNLTGERSRQQWDLQGALKILDRVAGMLAGESS